MCLTSATEQHNRKSCLFSPQYCYWTFSYQIFMIFGALGKILGVSEASFYARYQPHSLNVFKVRII